MSTPKVFISYSWTTPQYQSEVMDIADRLMREGGVNVVIDDYDLKEGQDIMVFMERMKHDSSLHFCLILSDAAYARKADLRAQGVGTEAQIISKEIYSNTDQIKFIPVVMERNEDGSPCLPTFLSSRKYIDFSSLESINQNWEGLVRLLHGKPARVKPKIGPPPAYLEATQGGHFVGLRATFNLLRQALLDGKPATAIYRQEMLDKFAEELEAAAGDTLSGDPSELDGILIWELLLRFQSEARDIIIDWMLNESRIDPIKAVHSCIIPILETLNSLPKLKDHAHRRGLIDSMRVFSYELALYCVACLIEVDSPEGLRLLMRHPFLDRRSDHNTYRDGLSVFYHYSEYAEYWKQQQATKWISPLIQIFKDRATHGRLTFEKLLQADALIFVVNLATEGYWYPGPMVYVSYGTKFPWFQKAKAAREPDRLAMITGKSTWKEVKDTYIAELGKRTQNGNWTVFFHCNVSYESPMGFVN